MAKFEVQVLSLQNNSNKFENFRSKLEQYSNRVDNIRNSLNVSGSDSIKSTLRYISSGIDQEANSCLKMSSTIESIFRKYEANEKRILENSKSLSTDNIMDSVKDVVGSWGNIPGIDNGSIWDKEWPPQSILDLIGTLAVIGTVIGNKKWVPENIANIIAGTLGSLGNMPSDGTTIMWNDPIISPCVASENDTSGSSVSGSVAYKEVSSVGGNVSGAFLTAEGEAGLDIFHIYAEGSAAVAKGQAGLDEKYGAVSVEGGFLQVKGEGSLGIPDSFSIGSDEAKTAGVDLAASAEVLGGEVEGRLGLESMNVHAKGEGSLVGAGAEAEAGLVMGDGKVGIKAQAGAEAYLAKGEISGGVTLFGVKFDATAEGMVGVQAEAGAELASTSANVNLGLGPIGLDIAIDWSDFDLTFWN